MLFDRKYNSLTFHWLLQTCKIFPDLLQNSLILKNVCFSLTFPWPWQPCHMNPPTPIWKFQVSFKNCFKCLGLIKFFFLGGVRVSEKFPVKSQGIFSASDEWQPCIKDLREGYGYFQKPHIDSWGFSEEKKNILYFFGQLKAKLFSCCNCKLLLTAFPVQRKWLFCLCRHTNRNA